MVQNWKRVTSLYSHQSLSEVQDLLEPIGIYIAFQIKKPNHDASSRRLYIAIYYQDIHALYEFSWKEIDPNNCSVEFYSRIVENHILKRAFDALHLFVMSHQTDLMIKYYEFIQNIDIYKEETSCPSSLKSKITAKVVKILNPSKMHRPSFEQAMDISILT